MATKVMTFPRLSEFIEKCKTLFAPHSEVADNDINIETYVLNIDYENNLAFDTSFIVSGSATSPTIDIGQVGFMVIAES